VYWPLKAALLSVRHSLACLWGPLFVGSCFAKHSELPVNLLLTNELEKSYENSSEVLPVTPRSVIKDVCMWLCVIILIYWWSVIDLYWFLHYRVLLLLIYLLCRITYYLCALQGCICQQFSNSLKFMGHFSLLPPPFQPRRHCTGRPYKLTLVGNE